MAEKLVRSLLHGDGRSAFSWPPPPDDQSRHQIGSRKNKKPLVAPVQLRPMKVGVVSDTHGLLRPEVVRALAGVEHILHLGDVGDPAILKSLEKLAPVNAIRGN